MVKYRIIGTILFGAGAVYFFVENMPVGGWICLVLALICAGVLDLLAEFTS